MIGHHNMGMYPDVRKLAHGHDLFVYDQTSIRKAHTAVYNLSEQMLSLGNIECDKERRAWSIMMESIADTLSIGILTDHSFTCGYHAAV